MNISRPSRALSVASNILDNMEERIETHQSAKSYYTRKLTTSPWTMFESMYCHVCRPKTRRWNLSAHFMWNKERKKLIISAALKSWGRREEMNMKTRVVRDFTKLTSSYEVDDVKYHLVENCKLSASQESREKINITFLFSSRHFCKPH